MARTASGGASIVIALVDLYWARDSNVSPGSDAAASARVAPQCRCHRRYSGAVKKAGMSCRTSPSSLTMSRRLRRSWLGRVLQPRPMMARPTRVKRAWSGCGDLESDQPDPGEYRQFAGIWVIAPLPPSGQQEPPPTRAASSSPGTRRSLKGVPASAPRSAWSSDPSGTAASSTPPASPAAPVVISRAIRVRLLLQYDRCLRGRIAVGCIVFAPLPIFLPLSGRGDVSRGRKSRPKSYFALYS